MRTFLTRIIAAGVLLPAALLADPSQWNDTSGLTTVRNGTVEFEAHDGNDVLAYTYRSTAFNPNNSPIWILIHGTDRDAAAYRDRAAAIAERQDALAIAIEFTETQYPNYQQDQFLFTEIDNVFDAITDHLGGSQPGYYIFGHSGGAQFIHRMLTFNPNAKVLGAVAANAGWYTLPNRDDSMPYGLAGTSVTDDEIARLLTLPFAVLVGENDTETPSQDPNLRGTPEAMAQGVNRRERGEYYFNAGQTAAADACTEGCCHSEPNWEFDVVPQAEHKSFEMIESSAVFLFESGASCTTEAGDGNIIFTEFLADPATGLAGDANRDGVRDSLDDEFVRMTNVGSVNVCMAGWSLGDVSKPTRYVLPLGEPLAPGESVVVFGGGLPTGDFGAAAVQTVPIERVLSLSNGGDVLTLRDINGDVEAQVSWDDCDGAACAADHIPFDVNINRPIQYIDGFWQ